MPSSKVKATIILQVAIPRITIPIFIKMSILLMTLKDFGLICTLVTAMLFIRPLHLCSTEIKTLKESNLTFNTQS